jgi:hypothetical protein
MFQIPAPDLFKTDVEALRELQNGIDVIVSYADQVAAARDAFDKKPSALFKRIRSALAKSCGELERCVYCEDSNADEVEHISPKKFFPEKTFYEGNYVFVCGRCNPIKRENFSILHSGGWIDLECHRKAYGIVAPPKGTSRFIDPIIETPMSFLWLDILGGTFFFTELPEEGTIEFERANYTITTLRLNDRGALVKSRKVAYTGFMDRMHRYIDDKNCGKPIDILRNRLIDIYLTPHQTVRLEIGRQLENTTLPKGAATAYPELFQPSLPQA